MTREQWIKRYTAVMVALGFGMQFSTECAEASFENKEDDILTPEEMVQEDLSYWQD